MNHAPMNISSPTHLCIFLLLFIISVDAFYFSSTNFFKFNDPIQAKTVKLTSIPRALPFGYYTFFNKELPFCKPKDPGGKCDLGQCLSGDWIQDSLYTVCPVHNHNTLQNDTIYHQHIHNRYKYTTDIIQARHTRTQATTKEMNMTDYSSRWQQTNPWAAQF